MTLAQNATKAYKMATEHRSLREQEADIFNRVNYALKSATGGRKLDLIRALADNRRLWSTLLDVMVDPENALPLELRASIISLARAVDREMTSVQPNLNFLIAINENIADGLRGA